MCEDRFTTEIIEYDDWWEADEEVYIHVTDEELENFDWDDNDE